jgi:hypothetical protein
MEDSFAWLDFDEYSFNHIDHCLQSEKTIEYDPQRLKEVVSRIGRAEGQDLMKDIQERSDLITLNMGSLRLCQLDRGELLRELGAIDSLLYILSEMKHWIVPNMEKMNKEDYATTAVIKLSTTCWQALRDLACGSIGNRTAIRNYTTKEMNGIQLMVHYLEIFDEIPWDVLDSLQLQLVTAVIGVMRNVSHKTFENCKELHESGATALLSKRLLHGAQNANLPPQESPWREGCFRASGTLLNLSEEYEPCLQQCGTNALLVDILFGSWGSNQRYAPVFNAMTSLSGLNYPQR